MTDQVFGALDFDGCYWNGHLKLDWFGATRELTLMIDSCHESQTEISDHQREAYRIFLEQWPDLQETVVKEIIRYYNEEERFASGPDDPKEFAAWWPEIETVEEMVNRIELESVVVASDWFMEEVCGGKRCLYLLFSRRWAEDPNNNGVGIQLLNEEVTESGFQDIAF